MFVPAPNTKRSDRQREICGSSRMWGGKEPAPTTWVATGTGGGNRSDEQVLLLLLTVLYCNYSTQTVRTRQGSARLGWAGGSQGRVGEVR